MGKEKTFSFTCSTIPKIVNKVINRNTDDSIKMTPELAEQIMNSIKSKDCSRDQDRINDILIILQTANKNGKISSKGYYFN